MDNDQYQTDRLILRSWREEDKLAFREINADPRVMEYFPNIYTKEKSDWIVDESYNGLDWSAFVNKTFTLTE